MWTVSGASVTFVKEKIKRSSPWRETAKRPSGKGGGSSSARRAVLRGVVEDLRDVLVAVVRVEEVESPVLGAHGQGPRGDGLCGVPHKLGADGVAGLPVDR